MKIEVEDAQAGQIIMSGSVGNCMDEFEIRLCDGEIRYLVRDITVTPEVYRDALQLSVLDRCEPGELELAPKECD